MNSPNNQRSNIRPGMTVLVVLKQDQATGKLTQGHRPGHPDALCLASPWHKVRLQNGLVGRVQRIMG